MSGEGVDGVIWQEGKTGDVSCIMRDIFTLYEENGRRRIVVKKDEWRGDRAIVDRVETDEDGIRRAYGVTMWRDGTHTPGEIADASASCWDCTCVLGGGSKDANAGMVFGVDMVAAKR